MNNAKAVDFLSRAADRMLHLAAQKQQLMREAALMVVSDAQAAAAHLAQLEAFEVRLLRAGGRERHRINAELTKELTKARARATERASAHAANLVRMDGLVEQAGQIERELAALGTTPSQVSPQQHGEQA